MNRYNSDSDDIYYASHQQSNNIRASGWQSPVPSSSSITRIVVECPFGSKKCDYTIDKSQHGRLIITARRRNTFASDYLSLNNKNNVAIQTFLIPHDADVNRLQSHIERYTNRLIIEIPRLRSKSINTNNTYTDLVRLPNILKPSRDRSELIYDNTKYSRKNLGNNQKFEYQIDCHGYTGDELDVFIQGRDLIVQGKTKRIPSSDPTRQHITKKFSRKIALPNTVDLARVVSYYENGKLYIEAPVKNNIYYNDKENFLPKVTSITPSNTTPIEFNRIQSPIPGNHQHHYRRHERVSRHRAYDREGKRRPPPSSMRRVRSAESLSYPFYRSPEEFVEDDIRDNEHRKIVNHERYISHRNDKEQQPEHRSVYSPTNNIVTTKTVYRDYPRNENAYFYY